MTAMPVTGRQAMLLNTSLVLWLIHLLSYAQISCLRLTLLKVPDSRPVGYDVRLTCGVDLEGDVLYTVRWFHNDKEFYRFSPSEDPNVMVFPKRGINIDVNRSTNTSVVLQHLDGFSAGSFRCEVLADAPHFRTVTAEAFMSIGEFYNGAQKGYHNPKVLVMFFCIFVKIFLL